MPYILEPFPPIHMVSDSVRMGLDLCKCAIGESTREGKNSTCTQGNSQYVGGFSFNFTAFTILLALNFGEELFVLGFPLSSAKGSLH